MNLLKYIHNSKGSFSKTRNHKRRGITGFLIYPFILMIILDIFALGISTKQFGGTGNVGIAVGACVNAGGNELQCLQQNYPSCGFNLSCIISQHICDVSNSLAVCEGLGIGQSLQGNTGNGIFAFTSNPFIDPAGFIIVIIIILSIITIAGIAIFGISVLNAGTAYILFIAVVLMVTWAALLSGGAVLFGQFPCYDFVKTQVIYSCPYNGNALPVLGQTVYVGYTIQFLLTLSVLLGIVDTVAL